jgi:hypothetical protein
MQGLSVDDLVAGLESIGPLKGEWKLGVKKVWKGSGMIQGTKVDVWSIYDHPEKVRGSQLANPSHVPILHRCSRA